MNALGIAAVANSQLFVPGKYPNTRHPKGRLPAGVPTRRQLAREARAERREARQTAKTTFNHPLAIMMADAYLGMRLGPSV